MPVTMFWGLCRPKWIVPAQKELIECIERNNLNKTLVKPQSFKIILVLLLLTMRITLYILILIVDR